MPMVYPQLQKYVIKTLVVLSALICFHIYGLIAGYNYILGILLALVAVFVFMYYNFPHWSAYLFIISVSFAELLNLPVTQGGFSSAVAIALGSFMLGVAGAISIKDRHLIRILFDRKGQILPLLFLILMVVSLMNSRAIGYSVKQIQQFIYLVVIFYFLQLTIRNREVLRKSFLALMIGGGFAGLFGMMEALLQQPVYFLLGNRSLFGAYVADALLNAKRGRIIGLVGDAPFHGIYMTIIALVAIYFLFTSRRTSARVLSFLIFLLSVFNILGTGSRGAFISLTIGLILFWVLSDIPYKATIMVSTLIAGAVVAIFMVSFMSDLDASRSFTYKEESTETAEMRLKNIPVALAMFKDHPIIGNGPDGFVINYSRYASNITNLAFREKILKTHNTPMQILAEYGLAGISIFALLIFITMKRMMHIIRHGQDRNDRLMAVVFFSAIAGYLFFMSTSNSLLDKYFWLLIALGQIHYSLFAQPVKTAEQPKWGVV